MEYNKVIAVTGLPGLYELLSSKADGAIVRALDDKSTRFVSSRIHNFSHLESIEVYTVRDNVNLVTILKAMEESDEKLPDERDSAALQKYFQKVYKDLDFDRVYSSDLKKMVKWFSVLKKNDVDIKLSEPAEEPEPEVEPVAEVKVREEPKAEKKKAAPSETRPAPKKAEEKKAEEKKPAAKKAAARKKEEVKEEPKAEKKPKKAAAPKKAAPKKK